MAPECPCRARQVLSGKPAATTSGRSEDLGAEHRPVGGRPNKKKMLGVLDWLPAQEPGEDEGCDDGGVGFDDELWGVDVEFAPGDFFVGDGTGVRTVGGGGVGNLAEIAPERDVVPFEVLVHHGDHADGEVAGDAATDLEEANALSGRVVAVPVGEPDHVFNAGFHGRRGELSLDAVGGEDVAHGAVFPAGDDDGEVFFGSGQHPGMLCRYLIVVLHHTAEKQLVHEFVWEEALVALLGILPYFEDVVLYFAEGFFFGDAGVGDTVEAFFEEFVFLFGGEIAVVGHTAVVGVGHQVHDVFFEVCACAGDNLHFVVADHFGQRDPQFGGAHGPCDGDKHFAAFEEVGFVALCGINEGGRVEMTVMVADEL